MSEYTLVYRDLKGEYYEHCFAATPELLAEKARMLALQLSGGLGADNRIVTYSYTEAKEYRVHLLACIAEESAELSKEACKLIRFQANEANALASEAKDVLTVLAMYDAVMPGLYLPVDYVSETKINKVLKHFMEEIGFIQELVH